MTEVRILPGGRETVGFIPAEFLPAGRDEYYLRNEQNANPSDHWRPLRSDEIEALVKNGNSCGDWDSVLVADPFNPNLVKGCEFVGLVRLGRLESVALWHNDLQMPAGITNSRVISCDVGDNAAIHNVRHLAHYIIADHVMLLNIDEMLTTNHAKFGNGIIKDGEAESARIRIDLANENGGRSVAGFDGMIPADAYIWAKYRGDELLMERLSEITQEQFDSRRGFYGFVGSGSVIKNSRIIKDVKIGESCYIKGANKLKNLTINSSADEPTQIGEGVELVNGIISPGCRVFYGCKAVRFVMCANTSLKYGARLLHSVLGDNSTISCCEMLNNLVFPAHEQHHNNSFLIASIVMGQSNLPAGASIGSNHNSRACDGEIVAGRGFWPGLATSIKHSSRFASFILLAKGDYPAELDIPLPFSLLSNDVARDRLVIMPAYWWMYNMYALARNSYKCIARDVRKARIQHIEFESLAPDTVEEIIAARTLLEEWSAQAYLAAEEDAAAEEMNEQDDAEMDEYVAVDDDDDEDDDVEIDDDTLIQLGRDLLSGPAEDFADLEIVADGIENSSRKTVILKAREAWQAYGQMLQYYAVKNLLGYLSANADATVKSMAYDLESQPCSEWVNLGGQLVRDDDLQDMLDDIKTGKLDSWSDIHARYDKLWSEYPNHKHQHAMAVLLELLQADALTEKLWDEAVEDTIDIAKLIAERVKSSRCKDFKNEYRRITFDSEAEMHAVLGSCEDDEFIRHIQDETESFIQMAKQ